jgi:hypothetical protein
MRFMIASIVLALTAGLAHAADPTCEAKAVDKNGKPLVGAAKASSIKKCEKEGAGSACAAKAIDKNGKPLVGAAKASSIKKCEKEAAAPAAAASK